MAELKELTDKNEYKKIIDKITEELEKEFLELKEEAYTFSISKNSERVNNPQIKKSASLQKPAVLVLDNLKVENVKTKKISAVNCNDGKAQKAPSPENLTTNELVDFNYDEELFSNPANAK